jgi:hypothetical protein
MSTLTTSLGEPARVVIVIPTQVGPTIYTCLGKTLVEQLRYCASLQSHWAQTGCACDSSAWIKPTARAAWERA